MEQLDNTPERQIMPREVFEHFVRARTDTYASGRESVMGLNIPRFKGYRYPEEPKEGVDRFVYEDNFKDSKKRPGNFGGFEIVKDVTSDEEVTLYSYAGGLTKEGLKLGEEVVYERLMKFLGQNASDVRFGKNATYNFEDELGKWTYEGKGRKEDYGWKDDEVISLNGAPMHKLRGNGLVFIPGF